MTLKGKKNHYNVKLLKGYGVSINIKNQKVVLKGGRDPFTGEQDTELLFRLFVATFCHIPKNIVYKLFVRVCLKMTMKSRHYVVILRADRTNFFHSHLSSTFYINNKAEDSLLKPSLVFRSILSLWNSVPFRSNVSI
jgi:hypothetical protein